MTKLAILFCSCFILLAGYNFMQAVASFYLFSLTIDQNSQEFKDKKNDLMSFFQTKKWIDMVEKQGKKLEQMVI